MRFSVLASGSRGNCTYIETNSHKCLIDIGTSFQYTISTLENMDINPEKIDSIFITHTHVDHINGLKRFIKTFNPTIYLTEKMHKELSFELKKYVYIDKIVEVDDLMVEVIKLSHDVNDINGYIFNSDKKSIVYITDTGYINIKNHSRLLNKNIYIMESNHDVDMLMKCTYPYNVKMRILGDKGHLSNKDSAYYLSNFVGKDTNSIVLAHLSEDNNDASIAIDNLKEVLFNKRKKVDNIIAATQDARTELIEV